MFSSIFIASLLFLKICFNKVVLPTPFVPIIATLSLDFISKFTFCKSTSSNDIPKLYIDIVGKKTDLPLNYEIDQFFSYLYETYKDNAIEPTPPIIIEPQKEYKVEDILQDVFIGQSKIEDIILNLDYKKT